MPETTQEQIEKIASETKTAVDAKIKSVEDAMNTKAADFATKAQIVELEAKAAKVDALEATLRTQGETITALKNGGVGVAQGTSAGQQFKSWISNDTNKKAFEAFKNHETNSLSLDLSQKAAGTMGISTVNTNQSGTYASTPYLQPYPELIPGLIDIRRNQPFIVRYANVSSTTSAVIAWIEKINVQGAAAITAEGALKPLVSFDYFVNRSQSQKIAGVIKVSQEMLADIDFMQAEIDKELAYQVAIALDAQLLSGNGTGGNLKGITSYVGGYTATGISGLGAAANNFDAIRSAIAQVITLNFVPDTVFIHPYDAAKMEMSKNSQGFYLLPPFVTVDKSGNNLTLNNVKIVETNQIPQGSFLLGDMTQFMVRIYKPYFIQLGWVNDDFQKNLVTLIGETRVHAYMPKNAVGAFVYDTFANVKTAVV